jgi:TPP-dependent pyruvate/acetoin dehydrogenase alpha subunit
MASSVANKTNPISKDEFKNQVISDYITAYKSRQTSLTGRKEVLTGKAKFGIFGDGKEVAQVAMARYMQNGDFRAGYYRDQTIMFALGLSDVQKFFAQLYAHPSTEHEPSSAGRSMNGHFGTRMLDDDGNWLPQTDRINISSDISPTAGQMPRALGLLRYINLIKIYTRKLTFLKKEMKYLGLPLETQVHLRVTSGKV